MVTCTINIPPMLAYIPYMDPMGYKMSHLFTSKKWGCHHNLQEMWQWCFKSPKFGFINPRDLSKVGQNEGAQEIPSGKLTYNSDWKLPFIVDFPMKNGGSFHSFLLTFTSLPEGKWWMLVNAKIMELDDGKIYRKTLYLMVKTMVSCRFSLKPIHW